MQNIMSTIPLDIFCIRPLLKSAQSHSFRRGGGTTLAVIETETGCF